MKLKQFRGFNFTLERATSGSVGFDLRAAIDVPVKVYAGETVKIGSGLGVHIDFNYWSGKVYSRSGLGSKGLVVGSGVGVIDPDYTGEIFLPMRNANLEGFFQIMPGDRIAQIVFEPVTVPDFELVTEFGATDRGSGGFGHTGI